MGAIHRTISTGGAAFGVKTFFKSGDEWQLLSSGPGPKAAILDRCVFKNRRGDVFLVTDAYEGSEIKSAVTDFLSAAAGVYSERISAKVNSAEVSFAAAGAADLLAYIGPLKAALNGWIANEDDETIRHGAAQAYDKYQKCGARAALRVFSID
jgi:hypothetical protein